MARGLLNDPWILFLDEPTLGLDVAAARGIRDLVLQWKAAVPGRTVLLTTHYMAEADELCERIAIVDHGRILAIGTPDELKRRVQRESIFRAGAGPPRWRSAVARAAAGRRLGRPGRGHGSREPARGRQPRARGGRRAGRRRHRPRRPGLPDPGPAQVGAHPGGRVRGARGAGLRRRGRAGGPGAAAAGARAQRSLPSSANDRAPPAPPRRIRRHLRALARRDGPQDRLGLDASPGRLQQPASARRASLPARPRHDPRAVVAVLRDPAAVPRPRRRSCSSTARSRRPRRTSASSCSAGPCRRSGSTSSG